MSEMPPMSEKITDPVAVWPSYFRESAPEDTTQNLAIVDFAVSDTLTLDEPVPAELPKRSRPDFRLPRFVMPRFEKHITHTWRRGAIACAAAIGVGIGAAYLSDQLVSEKMPQTTEAHKEPAAEIEPAEEPTVTSARPPATTPEPQNPLAPAKAEYRHSLPKATAQPQEVPSFSWRPQTKETPSGDPTPTGFGATPPAATPTTPAASETSPGQSIEPTPTSPPAQTETPNTPLPSQDNPQTSPVPQASPSASVVEAPVPETSAQQTTEINGVSDNSATERPEMLVVSE
jgi:hypothetical protein